MKRSILPLLFILLLALPAFADSKDDAARVGRDIAPFLNNDTPILIHFNLDQLDIEALITFAADLLKQTGASDADIQQASLVIRSSKGFIQHFKDIGFHHVYVAGNLNFNMNAQQPLALTDPFAPPDTPETHHGNFGVGVGGPLIFPLEPGAKEEAIIQIINQYRASLGRDIAVEKVGNAIVVASPAIIEHAKTVLAAKIDHTPQLAQALESVGTHMFDIVFIPTEDMRKVFEQLMPMLPPELGGGSTTLLTRNVLFEVATLKAPPDPMIDLRIQADSPDHAQALLALWKKADTLIRKQAAGDIKTIKNPDAAGDPVTVDRVDQEIVNNVLNLVQPKVEADQLALKIDAAGLLQWGKILIPSVKRAQQQSLRVQSLSHIKQLLAAATEYAAAQNDHLPNALDYETLSKYGVDENAFINPSFPDRSPAYLYLKPATGWSKTPATTIIVYENIPDGIHTLAVGYADGHAEIQKTDAFKSQLKKQQNP